MLRELDTLTFNRARTSAISNVQKMAQNSKILREVECFFHSYCRGRIVGRSEPSFMDLCTVFLGRASRSSLVLRVSSSSYLSFIPFHWPCMHSLLFPVLY